MTDNQLQALPTPVSVNTSDMAQFPDTTIAASKGKDASGTDFVLGDGNGFVLFDANTSLVNYTATQYTKGTYTVTSAGTVTQVTTGYE